MAFKKGEQAKGSTPFEEGKTGNPNGRPRKLPDLDKILGDVLGEEDGSGRTVAEQLLHNLIAQSKRGNVRATEILLDRGYGKAKQDVEQKTIVYSVDVTREEAKQIADAIKAGI